MNINTTKLKACALIFVILMALVMSCLLLSIGYKALSKNTDAYYQNRGMSQDLPW